MKPLATDWHDVALAKLSNVMGPSLGQQMAASVLEELGLSSLASPAELRRFASALSQRGGFASAVAALLTLHAAMYDSAESRSA